MDYQDMEHYAEVVIGGAPEDIADWQTVARDLFERFDNVAATIAQWDNSEIGDVDALIRIQEIINAE